MLFSGCPLKASIKRPGKTAGLIIIVAGTCICVLLINLVAYIALFDPHLGQSAAVLKWNLLLNLNHPVDTIIVGDSSCAYGVLPDIVEQQLGGSAVNLAIDAGSAPLYNAWMVDTYIKKFGAPKNVILVCTAHTYSGDTPLDCVAKVPLPWGFWEGMRPKPQWAGDINSLLFIFVDRYFPLYSQKLYISEIVQTPDLPRVLVDRINAGTYKGANTGISEADPLNLELQSQEMLKVISKNPFQISSDNMRSLSSITNLAKEYNFNVYLVNSPIYEQVYNNPSYKRYFLKFLNDIYRYVDNKTTYLVFESPMTFTELQMQNPNHLIYSAAQIYTRSMIASILSIKHNQANASSVP